MKLAECPVGNVANVLHFYHPDDDEILPREQEGLVTRLAIASKEELAASFNIFARHALIKGFAGRPD